MSWHDRYKEMKKGMGWTNNDIAEIIGNTPCSIRTVTKPSGTLPRWVKLSIVVFEKLHNKHDGDN